MPYTHQVVGANPTPASNRDRPGNQATGSFAGVSSNGRTTRGRGELWFESMSPDQNEASFHAYPAPRFPTCYTPPIVTETEMDVCAISHGRHGNGAGGIGTPIPGSAAWEPGPDPTHAGDIPGALPAFVVRRLAHETGHPPYHRTHSTNPARQQDSAGTQSPGAVS